MGMTMVTMWIILFAFCTASSSSSAAAASRVLRTSSSSTAGTPTSTFCGSACSAEDQLKLRDAFLKEVKAHRYEDAGCRSDLKAYICAICLPPAPASEPFSNTTASISNNSSLPLLPCATPSPVSIHDLTSSPSTESPPTPDWLPADDDSKAPTTPKWLIGLLASVLSALLGGFVAYKVLKPRLECCNNNNNNHCCTNINCCLCWV